MSACWNRGPGREAMRRTGPRTFLLPPGQPRGHPGAPGDSRVPPSLPKLSPAALHCWRPCPGWQERRKVPTGFFLLPLKELQVFVPETHG